ncbi:MAG: type II secretion system GspH family protein [Oscillospiraceae bacterium]|nr:type II secretion system GspH family protein [Oscillospiraceae bacterium]
MTMKKAKGFTLIEMIVVIAIIGVLACILIPSMMNHMKEAQKVTDVANAKTLYDNVISIMMLDSDAEYSFYGKQHGLRTEKNVTVNEGTSEEERYRVAVCCQIGGKKAGLHNDNYRAFIHGGTNEASDFAEKLNKVYGFIWQDLRGKKRIGLPMKYSTSKNGSQVSRILVCVRLNEGYHTSDKRKFTDQIEIWAGDSGTNPLYRLYPSPDVEYQ